MADEEVGNTSTFDAESPRSREESAIAQSIKEGQYEIFTPPEMQSDRDLPKLIKQTARGKIFARFPRIFVFIFILCSSFTMLALFPDRDELPATRLFGYILLTFFISYFIHLYYIFLIVKCDKTRHIYRIYSLNSVVPNWSHMSISYRALLFRYHPIESISEFSAIQGGIAHTMLLALSTYSWVMLVAAMAFELSYDTDRQSYRMTFVDVFELIGCFGLYLIGTYELDPFNKTMQTMHYLGAALGVFTLVGFTYQQVEIGINENNLIGHIITPIVLSVLATVCFILWQYFGIKAEKYAKEVRINPEKHDPNIVTNISLQNVVSESIFLFCGALSMCLFLINYDQCYDIAKHGC